MAERVPPPTPERSFTATEYNHLQTAACNALRTRLQSIATLAVDAQDMDPSGDPLQDQLRDILADLQIAQRINEALGRDDVSLAASIARTGRID